MRICCWKAAGCSKAGRSRLFREPAARRQPCTGARAAAVEADRDLVVGRREPAGAVDAALDRHRRRGAAWPRRIRTRFLFPFEKLNRRRVCGRPRQVAVGRDGRFAARPSAADPADRAPLPGKRDVGGPERDHRDGRGDGGDQPVPAGGRENRTIAVESPTFYAMLHAIERMGMKAIEVATHPNTGSTSRRWPRSRSRSRSPRAW